MDYETLNNLLCSIIVLKGTTITFINNFAKQYMNIADGSKIISELPKEEIFFEKEIRIDTNTKVLNLLASRNGNMVYLQDCIHKRNNFLANLGHEIKTPTNCILGMTSLLSEMELSKESHGYIGFLNEACYSLIKIINDMLDYSKLVSGKLITIESPFSLRDCLKSAQEVFMGKIKELSISMDYYIDPKTPEFIIADTIRLQQILINLYGNSIKAVKPHQGLIKTSIYYKEDKMYFSIKDNGVGIPEEGRDKLFSAYSQLYNDYSLEFSEGIGIGLSICKELTKVMKGDIWLENSSPEGTDFRFYISVKECKDTLKKEKEECEDYSILQDKKVLVVDDNAINRIALFGMLSNRGCKIFNCSTVDEALAYIDTPTKFDLILLDIHMPKLNGIELAKKMREKSSVPIIALSSIGDKLPIENKLFSNILLKPIELKLLLRICCDTLSFTDTKYIIKYPNVKILIDEDVPMNQMVLITLLNKLGYTNIKTVENGQEAINLLQKEDFDIAFIDIKTPFKTGLDVIKEIKKMKKKIFSIALTGFIIDPVYLKDQGFDSSLFKPLEIKNLQKVLDGVANIHLPSSD